MYVGFTYYKVNLKLMYSLCIDVNKYSEILTVRNIVKKLAAWSNKWISIAEHLEVPSAVISTIRVITTHQQSKDTALYRVVEWWFANNPNPEWLTIDSVIVELGMELSWDYYTDSSE